MVPRNRIITFIVACIIAYFLGAGTAAYISHSVGGQTGGSDNTARDLAASDERYRDLERRYNESIERSNTEIDRLEEYVWSAVGISDRIGKRARGSATTVLDAIEILKGVQKEVGNLEIWRNSVTDYIGNRGIVYSVEALEEQ